MIRVCFCRQCLIPVSLSVRKLSNADHGSKTTRASYVAEPSLLDLTLTHVLRVCGLNLIKLFAHYDGWEELDRGLGCMQLLQLPP
jgi:hypothetical protein